MRARILVTGSSGLIGSSLVCALAKAGYEVAQLDLRADGLARGDILNRKSVDWAIRGCVGVVHLAAMSRVAHGEFDPAKCWETNVEGTSTVLDSALTNGCRWVIYASSREVYGHVGSTVVDEDRPLAPVNAYGRSKVAAEERVVESGLLHSILRFSNVYGGKQDHIDRVVPAFVRAALSGEPLVVNGQEQAFDFTHLGDVVRGVVAVVDRLQQGVVLPPIHFVTGVSTTLGELARLIVDLTHSRSPIIDGPPRKFDVTSFHGHPGRAQSLLDWQAGVSLRAGLTGFVDSINNEPRA